MAENKLGITKLKSGLTGVGFIIKGAVGIDSNGDGKVSGTESIAFATQALPAALPILMNFGDIRAETKGAEFTEEEREEAIQHLVSLDILPEGEKNDIAEEWIDDTILWLRYNERYIKRSIEAFKAMKTAGELDVDAQDLSTVED